MIAGISPSPLLYAERAPDGTGGHSNMLTIGRRRDTVNIKLPC